MLPFWFLLPLALLGLVAASVHATTTVWATFGSAVSGGSFTPLCDESHSPGSFASVTCSEVGNSGEASASAQHGSLGAYAWVFSPNALTDNLSYQAYSRAYYTDDLTLGERPIQAGE